MEDLESVESGDVDVPHTCTRNYKTAQTSLSQQHIVANDA